jgi:hypothetical protein
VTRARAPAVRSPSLRLDEAAELTDARLPAPAHMYTMVRAQAGPAPAQASFCTDGPAVRRVTATGGCKR